MDRAQYRSRDRDESILRQPVRRRRGWRRRLLRRRSIAPAVRSDARFDSRIDGCDELDPSRLADGTRLRRRECVLPIGVVWQWNVRADQQGRHSDISGSRELVVERLTGIFEQSSVRAASQLNVRPVRERVCRSRRSQRSCDSTQPLTTPESVCRWCQLDRRIARRPAGSCWRRRIEWHALRTRIAGCDLLDRYKRKLKSPAGSSQAVSLAGAAKLGNTLITAGRDGAGATITDVRRWHRMDHSPSVGAGDGRPAADATRKIQCARFGAWYGDRWRPRGSQYSRSGFLLDGWNDVGCLRFGCGGID